MTETEPDRREHTLLLLAAQGDRRALAQIYELHVDALYSFIYFRVGGDRSLAEDAVQDTFLQALAQTGAFDPRRGSLRGWLCETSRNVTRKYRQTGARLETLASDDHQALAHQLLGGLAPEPAPIADEVLARDVQALVSAAVASLAEPNRSLLERKYLGGLSLEDLAR